MKKYTMILLIGSMMIMNGCIGAGKISDIQARDQEHFPALLGIDLHGEERKIPESFTGEFNLVAIAFQREQQADVDTWIPLADKMIIDNPGLAFYELPVIYELNMANRMFVNNGMRAGIEADHARTRTITIYTNRDNFLSMMGMQVDNIYVLLLDKEGKILWQHTGVANAEAIDGLNSVLSKKSNK